MRRPKRTIQQRGTLNVYIGQRNRRLKNPQIWTVRLWEACEESGLPVLEKLWIVTTRDATWADPSIIPKCVIMTAKVQLPDGSIGVVDQYPKTTAVGDPKKEREVQLKRDWCASQGIPYLNVKVGTKTHYMAHIQMWLMRQERERRLNA